MSGFGKAEFLMKIKDFIAKLFIDNKLYCYGFIQNSINNLENYSTNCFTLKP